MDAAALAKPVFAVVSVTLKLDPATAEDGGLLMLVITRSAPGRSTLKALLGAPVSPDEDTVKV